VPAPVPDSSNVQFVWDSELGWGRQLAGEDTLRFFDSPTEPEKVISSVGRVFKPSLLPVQTRAWWFDGDKWLIGRVDIPADSAASHYWVNFPNLQTERIPAADLRVRWARPIADPLSLVKALTVETRYFHTRRTNFTQNVARQRVACLNLRGLLSSAVEIHDHQVGAARRVLSDPIPRYLLADEVGLGKTIEAGMVIRQILLDPDANVTVIAPDHLVDQWEAELDTKFGVFTLPGTLDVVPQAEVQAIPVIPRSLLVVDEAHRLTERVDYNGSTNPSRRYHKVKALAHAADGLLLLSATPVRSNEDAFLGILHLLDPATYPLEDLAGFRRRVELRDDFAETVSALDDETPVRYLTEPLSKLRSLVPDDTKLIQLVDEALREATARNVQGARAAVRKVRVHVSETYRLHRRMVRTRRSSAAKAKFPVRGREHGTPWLIADPDRRRDELLSILESLRIDLLEHYEADAGDIFRVVLGRALAPLTALSDLAEALRGGSNHDLSGDELEALARFVATDTALELAQQIETLLAAESSDDRITATVQWCQRKVGRGKYAVACSFPRSAESLAKTLTASFGSHRVVSLLATHSDEERATALAKFSSNKEVNILVFDRSAEEGVNLQIAEEVLHASIPTATSQLEQRMGRFDRFSDSVLNPVRSTSFSEANELRQQQLGAWLRVLDGLFNVFESSTSTLQYVLADLEQEFFSTSIINGMREAADALERKRDFLETQHRRITAQDLLDSIEDRSDDEVLAEGIHETDNYQREIEDAAVGYIHEMLGFSLYYTESGNLKFGINQSKPPLLTEWEIQSLGTHLFQREYTTDRLAVRQGTGFLRYGEPLIDRFVEYADTDDRGRAFAVELPTPAKVVERPPILAFCFDFRISAAPSEVVSQGASSAFQRAVRVRTEHFLPAFIERVWWMVGRGECPPQIRHDLESRQGENLGSQPERFRELTSHFQWPAVCDEAFQAALAIVRTREGVAARLNAGRSRAQEAADRERSILNARNDPSDRTRIHEEVLEAVDHAVSNPVFTLDNCGAVFLTWIPQR